MKRHFTALVFVCLVLAASERALGQDTKLRQYPVSLSNAEKTVANVLRISPVIDGHNDLFIHYFGCKECPRDIADYPIDKQAKGHTDIPRWRKGGVGGQLINVFAEQLDNYLRAYDLLYRLESTYPNDLKVVGSSAEMRRAIADRKIALLPILEGAVRLQNDTALLRAYYRQGLRSVTLAYETNGIADGSEDKPQHNGLSPFGKEVVKEMNRLGIIADISHVSTKTMHDVIDLSQSPVIFSHSNARALCDVNRNVPDEVLLKLKKNRGVIMLTFVPYFATNKFSKWWTTGEGLWEVLNKKHAGDRTKMRADIAAWEKTNPEPAVTVAEMADHFDHVKRLIGVDHIGISGDFDGIDYVIKGLHDVSTYPNLLTELARRGWTEQELKKITGGNFLRVFEEVEAKAAVLKKTMPPSSAKVVEKK